MIDPSSVVYRDGLIAAVVRDVRRGTILTVAWMNEAALLKTMSSGETWFWSRSRQELWNKGAGSGNRQRVTGMKLDCDADAVLIDVEPAGPACHSGEVSCFGDDSRDRLDMNALSGLLRKRHSERPEGSYATRLFDRGVDAILKKVGEEATETILAVKGETRERVVSEVADLVFHLAVLLVEQRIDWSEIGEELGRRAGAR